MKSILIVAALAGFLSTVGGVAVAAVKVSGAADCSAAGAAVTQQAICHNAELR